MPPKRKAAKAVKAAIVTKTTVPKKIQKFQSDASESEEETAFVAISNLKNADSADKEAVADQSRISHVEGESFVDETHSESELEPVKPVILARNDKSPLPNKVQSNGEIFLRFFFHCVKCFYNTVICLISHFID